MILIIDVYFRQMIIFSNRNSTGMFTKHEGRYVDTRVRVMRNACIDIWIENKKGEEKMTSAGKTKIIQLTNKHEERVISLRSPTKRQNKATECLFIMLVKNFIE